ncbi:MAG: triose-phosphate isomerase [Clostridia bacterium]|nr:triose-phosphate isomerase [Clostridia bacterium]
MRKPIIAGNWKMFKTAAETEEFLTAFKPLVAEAKGEVLLCPPFTSLETAVKVCRGTNIQVGAQNMHWEKEGAFTGEIAPGMLTALGVTHCIIGHSERRQYFGETDETVNKKVQAAFNYSLLPIVCVGETLEEREKGISKEVCRRQVEQGLAGLESALAAKLVIAYEPVWAIGTGKTASPADAQEVIGYIRQVLGEMFGPETAGQIRIQYGGSVKPDNIKELMAQPDIDGALVGGASLKPESFAAIVNFD